MAERLLRIEEVALMANVSTYTINNWYRWKRTHPEHPMAKKLPEYIQEGSHKKRFWRTSDVWSIVEFKNTIPHGRNGILGDTTQIYTRRKKQCQE